MEGSVDEESTKSDEEYDDLAMKDGYSSDDEEEPRNGTITLTENNPPKDTNNNVHITEHDKKSSDQSGEASHKLRRSLSHSDRNQRSKEERTRNRSQSDFPRVRSRSHSIPSSFFGEPPMPQGNGRTSTPGFPFK